MKKILLSIILSVIIVSCYSKPVKAIEVESEPVIDMTVYIDNLRLAEYLEVIDLFDTKVFDLSIFEDINYDRSVYRYELIKDYDSKLSIYKWAINKFMDENIPLEEDNCYYIRFIANNYTFAAFFIYKQYLYSKDDLTEILYVRVN